MPRAVTLRVEGFFAGYAGIILREELPRAVMRTAKRSDSTIFVDVEAGEQSEGRFEPGMITVTAERLPELFDAGELRRCIQEWVDKAVEAGDRLAAEDEASARSFLNDLAVEPD